MPSAAMPRIERLTEARAAILELIDTMGPQITPDETSALLRSVSCLERFGA